MLFDGLPDYSAAAKELAPYLAFLGLAGKNLWDWLKNRKQDSAQVEKITADAERIAAETNALIITNQHDALKAAEARLKEANDTLDELRKTNDPAQRARLEQELKECGKYSERKNRAYQNLLSRTSQMLAQQPQTVAKIAYWETDGKGAQLYVGDEFYEIFDVTAANASDWKNRIVPADMLRIDGEWKRFIKDKDTLAAINFRKITGDTTADCISIYTIVRDLSGEVVEVIGLTMELK